MELTQHQAEKLENIRNALEELSNTFELMNEDSEIKIFFDTFKGDFIKFCRDIDADDITSVELDNKLKEYTYSLEEFKQKIELKNSSGSFESEYIIIQSENPAVGENSNSEDDRSKKIAELYQKVGDMFEKGWLSQKASEDIQLRLAVLFDAHDFDSFNAIFYQLESELNNIHEEYENTNSESLFIKNWSDLMSSGSAMSYVSADTFSWQDRLAGLLMSVNNYKKNYDGEINAYDLAKEFSEIEEKLKAATEGDVKNIENDFLKLKETVTGFRKEIIDYILKETENGRVVENKWVVGPKVRLRNISGTAKFKEGILGIIQKSGLNVIALMDKVNYELEINFFEQIDVDDFNKNKETKEIHQIVSTVNEVVMNIRQPENNTKIGLDSYDMKGSDFQLMLQSGTSEVSAQREGYKSIPVPLERARRTFGQNCHKRIIPEFDSLSFVCAANISSNLSTPFTIFNSTNETPLNSNDSTPHNSPERDEEMQDDDKISALARVRVMLNTALEENDEERSGMLLDLHESLSKAKTNIEVRELIDEFDELESALRISMEM